MEPSTILVGQSLFAIASAIVADQRGGAPLAWFILGAIFGPVALAIALTSGKKCRHCQRWIPKDATVCPRCTREQ